MTTSPVLLAVALSLVSALCYATAAVVQERTAAGTASLRGALVRGSWWWAVLLNVAGALLHVVALRYGPLSLVQPLGVLTLVVAVPLGSLVTGRRTSGTQWRGMALTLAGLTALLTVTASGGTPNTLSGTGVLVVALAAAVVIAALVRLASGPSALAGLAFAAASGIASAVGSTLSQKLAVEPTLSWSTAVTAILTVAFAAGGLLLAQKAYGSGLGGPLALLTLVNPVTASAIGVTLLGEGFQYGGTGALLALAGAVAAGRGVVLLSGSQPEPLHGSPEPVYGSPEPLAYDSPEPVFVSPGPVFVSPGPPAYDSPEPVFVSPGPAFVSPGPAFVSPGPPAYDSPGPAYVSPGPPAYDSPEPAYDTPEPAYVSTGPAYDSPVRLDAHVRNLRPAPILTGTGRAA